MATQIKAYDPSKVTPFTQADEKLLNWLREYVRKLRVLIEKIGAEFPEDKQILGEIANQIHGLAGEIVRLEMIKARWEMPEPESNDLLRNTTIEKVSK